MIVIRMYAGESVRLDAAHAAKAAGMAGIASGASVAFHEPGRAAVRRVVPKSGTITLSAAWSRHREPDRHGESRRVAVKAGDETIAIVQILRHYRR